MKIDSNTKIEEVAKRVERADVVALNRSMKPVIEQNKREYIASFEEIEKNHTMYHQR